MTVACIDPETGDPIQLARPYTGQRMCEWKKTSPSHLFPEHEDGAITRDGTWKRTNTGLLPEFSAYPKGLCDYEADILSTLPFDWAHGWRGARDAAALMYVDPGALDFMRWLVNDGMMSASMLPDCDKPEAGIYSLRTLMGGPAGQGAEWAGRGFAHIAYVTALAGTDEQKDALRAAYRHAQRRDGVIHFVEGAHERRDDDSWNGVNEGAPICIGFESWLAYAALAMLGMNEEADLLASSIPFPTPKAWLRDMPSVRTTKTDTDYENFAAKAITKDDAARILERAKRNSLYDNVLDTLPDNLTRRLLQ
jgi:surface antigen